MHLIITIGMIFISTFFIFCIFFFFFVFQQNVSFQCIIYIKTFTVGYHETLFVMMRILLKKYDLIVWICNLQIFLIKSSIHIQKFIGKLLFLSEVFLVKFHMNFFVSPPSYIFLYFFVQYLKNFPDQYKWWNSNWNWRK